MLLIMLKAQLLIRKTAQVAQAKGILLFGLHGKFLARLPYRFVPRNSHWDRQVMRPTVREDRANWERRMGSNTMGTVMTSWMNDDIQIPA